MYCDDAVLEEGPLINVDYLSHVWTEGDIWMTRRYVLREKRALRNSTRLENALWRTWMKRQQQLNTVSSDSVNWAKDSDVTWLYGPWKSIEPSPTAYPMKLHTPCQSSWPSVTKSALKRRTTQLSFTFCIAQATERPAIRPLGLEEDVLRTGGAGAWLRLLCPECLLSHMAVFIIRYITERSRYIWAQFPSKKRTKVQFSLEVRQCVAINSKTNNNATQSDEVSFPQNPTFKDALDIPVGYYPSMDRSLSCEKMQGQTIKLLPSTELKSSHAPIEPHRGANDADIEKHFLPLDDFEEKLRSRPASANLRNEPLRSLPSTPRVLCYLYRNSKTIAICMRVSLHMKRCRHAPVFPSSTYL